MSTKVAWSVCACWSRSFFLFQSDRGQGALFFVVSALSLLQKAKGVLNANANANAAGPTSCFERRTRIKDIARERSITHEVAKDQSAGGRDHAPRFSRNAISRALSLSLRSLLFYLSLISSAIIISLSLYQVLLNLNLNSIPPFRFSQPERLHEA